MPRKSETISLSGIQRLFAQAVMRPLAPGYRTNRKWGTKRTADVISRIVKPNDRLTSLERMEIYNKQYWFRIIECFREDFPGLQSVLGERKFDKLTLAYLEKHPSRSWTLRNLGQFLSAFLERHKRFIEPHVRLAQDMARFEWAQIEAFDAETIEPLSEKELAGVNPNKLRMSLQPCIRLLRMDYPLDDYVIALRKSRPDAGQVSNANAELAESAVKKVKLPRREPVCLLVHRFENSLYYKRLEPAAMSMLEAIAAGKTLAKACEAAISSSTDANIDWQEKLHHWFSSWARLGWLCKRSKR